MKTPSLYTLLLAVGFCRMVAAQEPQAIDVDEVLAKWDQAAARWTTVDAKFKCWSYDLVFNEVNIQLGMLYVERSGEGRYDRVREERTNETEKGYCRNRTLEPAQTVIWRDHQTLWIEPDVKGYRIFRRRAPVDDPASVNPNAEWMWISVFDFVWMTDPLSSFENFLPLLTPRDCRELKQRFELSVVQVDERILLTAKPRSSADQSRFQEIAVLIDPKTNLPFASRMVLPGGSQAVVHQLYDVRFDQPRHDRGELFNPDLNNFHTNEVTVAGLQAP